MESSTTNASGRASIGRWIARVLAVLAVAGAAIAVYLVISGSDLTGGGDHKKSSDPKPPKEQTQEEPPHDVVVQPGDTLGGIAAKYGVPVEKIEALNPDVDPQALASGTTLELR